MMHGREKSDSAILAQTRNLKMARSAHAYVRGSTVKFYEWLEASVSKVSGRAAGMDLRGLPCGKSRTFGGRQGLGHHSDTRSRSDRDRQSCP